MPFDSTPAPLSIEDAVRLGAANRRAGLGVTADQLARFAKIADEVRPSVHSFTDAAPTISAHEARVGRKMESWS